MELFAHQKEFVEKFLGLKLLPAPEGLGKTLHELKGGSGRREGPNGAIVNVHYIPAGITGTGQSILLTNCLSMSKAKRVLIFAWSPVIPQIKKDLTAYGVENISELKPGQTDAMRTQMLESFNTASSPSVLIATYRMLLARRFDADMVIATDFTPLHHADKVLFEGLLEELLLREKGSEANVFITVDTYTDSGPEGQTNAG